MRYNHTQIGYLIIFTLAAVALLFGFILMQESLPLPALLIMPFVLLILFSFASLNVMIDKEYLQVKFGWGIFRKRFKLKEIASAKVVKNHWYFGWGIRVWFWPYMWIYNVSSFDAVEIIMKNGKRYRIGTDEPKNLERAILQSIGRVY